MHPVTAIAWSTWLRHGRGIRLAAAALIAMAAVYPVLFSFVRTPAVLLISTLPPVFVLTYFMNVLLFTNEIGDLAAGYQRRLYALPLRTVTLVTWPMLIGAAGVALLWLLYHLIYTRSGLRPPLWTPALSLAALMMWFQALAWSPFAHRLVRLILVGALLPCLAAPVLWLWLAHGAASGQIACVLIGYCGAAYALALVGVGRDRCGHLSLVAWRGLSLWKLRAWRAEARPFRSAAAAQLASEWRSHGLIFPAFVGGLVVVSLGLMLIVGGTAKPGSRLTVLGAALLIPLAFASSLGTNIARLTSGPRGSTFLLTRPMSSAALAFVKFRAAFRSVLVTWGLVGIVAGLFIVASGLGGDAIERARALFERFPGWRIGVAGLLAVSAVVVVTWKQFTSGLVLRLTGCTWLVTLVEFAKAALVLLSCGVGVWFLAHPDALARIRAALPVVLPWVIGGAVVLKLVIALWSWRALLSRRLVETRTARAFACGWVVASACFGGLVVLVVPEARAAEAWPLVLGGVLAWMPLNRFALAPVALHRARHT